jgi:hypothetical protein
MTTMQLWARWSKRTRQFAPCGDILNATPYLYLTQDEAFAALDRSLAVGEELIVSVLLKAGVNGYAQIEGEPVRLSSERSKNA